MEAPFRTPSPPPISVPDHNGVRQPDAVYWAEPPPEIGKLLSAWSNQTKDGFVTNRSLRALVILLVVLGAMAVGLVFAAYDWLGVPGAAGCVVLLGLLVGFGVIESKSRPWCSYLGESGFSEHRQTWRRVEHTVVRFEAVAGLWLTRTEHHTNGVYKKTTEDYEWRSQAGLRLAHRQVDLRERGLAAAGERFGAGGKPLRNPSRELMLAAATEWRKCRLEKAEAELKEDGAAVFPTRAGGFFTIRPGSIETNVSGKATTLTHSDVVSSRLESGCITIKTSRGKLRFVISNIADHDIALALASEVAGLSLPS